jgi:hypothetical protein
MKLGIMQPYFFPYIGYFQLINAVDKYVIYDDVNYISSGWINRNNLLLNGQKHLFTLTLLGASSNKLINEISVNSKQYKAIKTIETVYKKAPYFEDVFPLVKQIFEYEDKNLARFVGNSITSISGYLNINPVFIYSSDIKEKDCSLKGQSKILQICSILGATEYINAIGGQLLYDKIKFKENKIELKFLRTDSFAYKQFRNEFVPHLSILDVMMFNSVEDIGEMLTKYELI